MLKSKIRDSLARILLPGTDVRGTIVQICPSKCEYEGGREGGNYIQISPFSLSERELIRFFLER
jgi:hypothetical protein